MEEEVTEAEKAEIEAAKVKEAQLEEKRKEKSILQERLKKMGLADNYQSGSDSDYSANKERPLNQSKKILEEKKK